MRSSGWLPTRGSLSSTSHNAVHAAQRRPAIAYGGIDVPKKQSQLCLLPEAGALLPHRIPTQRERGLQLVGAPLALVLDRRRRMR